MYVKEQLGHASIQITVDVYGHLVPGGNRAAVDRLDDEPQPSATPAQPEVVAAGTSQTLSALEPVTKPNLHWFGAFWRIGQHSATKEDLTAMFTTTLGRAPISSARAPSVPRSS